MLKNILIAAGLLTLTATAAIARLPQHEGIRVDEAWSRPAAAGTNGAGFFTITNPGPQADRLLSVSCPLADTVEMHQTSMADGIMSMRRIESGVTLPPGQSVIFEPGSRHLMLLGLRSALRAGGTVPLTFNLASGKRLSIVATVRLAPQPSRTR